MIDQDKRAEAADRQARSRAKRAAAGCSRVSVTLSPEAANALERLHAHHGGTIAETIAHTLIEADHRKTCTVRPYPNPPRAELGPLAKVIGSGVDPFGAEFVAGLSPSAVVTFADHSANVTFAPYRTSDADPVARRATGEVGSAPFVDVAQRVRADAQGSGFDARRDGLTLDEPRKSAPET